eukprot:s3253_g6.t2
MSWMWVSKTLAALLLAWSPCAVGGTCPLSGSRASPANILPPNAEPESGSVLMLYKGWNVSNLSIERIEETEETSGYLSLVFDGPEGGGSLQAGESFSDMDEYVLRRIRISMPSEHTLLNRRLPLEVQLWHEPAVHRDISRLITARAKVQQMLRRFHGLIRDWQFQLKRQEDPSASNASFPNLQTERDWAEAVRRDSIQDGEALMQHASQLRRQIAKIDEEVEVLNERLQRPQSARMVALSLLYAAPHDAVFAASGDFLRWLTLAIKRNEERSRPAKRNKAALQAEVQQLQQRLHEMQAEKKDELDGRGEERQLQTSHDAQTLQDQPLEVFHFEEFRTFGKDSVRALPLTALAYDGSFTRPPCTPVVRWYLVSEPQAASAKDMLGLAAVVLGDAQRGPGPPCQRVQGLEVCHEGISPSDGVWWSGPIKQVPESGTRFPDQLMHTVSLGFGSFHKPKETHLSSQLVSRLPWLYVQACCAVLLLCSIAMLGATCSMWHGAGDIGVLQGPPRSAAIVVAQNKNSLRLIIGSILADPMSEAGNAYSGGIKDGLFHGRGTLTYAGNERYEGEWVYGKREGHGRFTYADGAIFEGQWAEDRIHGQGVAVFASGNRYEGTWENGRIHGHGTLTYSNKDQYDGDWHDGKMHGRGTYRYAEGDVYQGEWRDDKRHGKGVVTYVSARGSVVEKFEGDWVNGKMHGHGKYQYADGGVYEGDWHDGKMHGKGIYVFPNGNTYDGEWVNDMKEGYGTLTYQNGEKYDGLWKADKVHGKGTLVYTYGDKFVGDWVDAKKEGEGELIYSNGDRFKGQWVDDRASGYGVFVYSNGNRYDGQWLDDKRHGRGVFACAEDGSVYDGEFAFGRKEGRGVLKLQSGHVLSGVWKQGELAQVVEFVFSADSPWKNPDL